MAIDMNNKLLGVLLLAGLFSCSEEKKTAETVFIHAQISTLNENQPSATALAIRGDRIIWVGEDAAAGKWIGPDTEVFDLEGQFVMPGFIEGHGHFSGLGRLLANINLMQADSWDEVVEQVEAAAKKAQPGEWIYGRGWHQEKWSSRPEPNVLGYPYHQGLSSISPDNPVILIHASGHALFANEAAMKAAGINVETPDPQGGEIVRDEAGNPIGVFEEEAMSAIKSAYNDYLSSLSTEQQVQRWYSWVEAAEAECLRKGVTSFQDAGVGSSEFEEFGSLAEMKRYQELAEEGKLDIRIWAMVRDTYDKLKGKIDQFPVIGAGNYYFTCRAIKSEVDGALGSFGAWLLSAYNDKPGFEGQNTTSISEVKNIASLATNRNMQFCVHAIGDRANRVVLDIYEEQFNQHPEKKDWRWRVEHAQHLDTADIPRFARLGIIASMQGIHCTSDAPFVVSRLGTERARLGAYAWRSLLDKGVLIANGTDTPVEDVDPIKNFYASVTRKREDTGMSFFPEQRMTRQEALYSYTLGNAYAAFEEDLKGSLEYGKLADLVVLSRDLRTCPDEEILDTKVLLTMVGGKVKYQRAGWVLKEVTGD
ncbi:MAG: amidohydrolase [Saprospirales bacterium]|nr:amidohydrolase [Saprospirales bacterium]